MNKQCKTFDEKQKHLYKSTDINCTHLRTRTLVAFFVKVFLVFLLLLSY